MELPLRGCWHGSIDENASSASLALDTTRLGPRKHAPTEPWAARSIDDKFSGGPSCSVGACFHNAGNFSSRLCRYAVMPLSFRWRPLQVTVVTQRVYVLNGAYTHPVTRPSLPYHPLTHPKSLVHPKKGALSHIEHRARASPVPRPRRH
eukprot:6969927-Prymnesium_polylepis.4